MTCRTCQFWIPDGGYKYEQDTGLCVNYPQPDWGDVRGEHSTCPAWTEKPTEQPRDSSPVAPTEEPYGRYA